MRRSHLLLFSTLFFLHAIFFCSQAPRTQLALKDGKWYLNERITCAGTPAEGLLMNVRMVNASFEDRNKPEFDAEANTAEFIARIPEYMDMGVRAFTLNLQGGMPGYEGALNSAFEADGRLNSAYMRRIERVIRACDRAGAAVILGLFYQRQDQILRDDAAVKNAVVGAAQWLRAKKFKNVALEIANEYMHRGFDRQIIKTHSGMAELIGLAKQTAPEFPVSASGMGDGRMDSTVAAAADFILIHFNSTPVPEIAERISSLRLYNKAIVCNEDDKLGAEAASALLAAVGAGCSWGYMNSQVNQTLPFDFRGAADDAVLYRTLRDLTALPLRRAPGLTAAERRQLDQLQLYAQQTLLAVRPTSGALVVSRGDSILLEKYLDGAQPQTDHDRIDRASLWPLWSCSKTFAVTLLLNLAHQGVLSLDDPVGKFLPEFASRGTGPWDRRKVTFRHLASHTSGAAVPGKTLEELSVDPPLDLQQVQIITRPGEVFLYSGLGMHLLERAVEAATGQDYMAALKQRVLEPLHLGGVAYYDGPDEAAALLPCRDGQIVYSERGYRAGTGLYATALDFNRFGRYWLGAGSAEDSNILTAELKQQAWTLHGIRASDQGRYGLLWWLFEDQGGFVMSGAGYVVNAVAPQTGVVVTLMRNHVGVVPESFDYYADKKTLVEFAAALGR